MTPSLSPGDWQWARHWLDRLDGLPPDQRAGLLDEACAERADLAAILRSLVESPAESLHIWSETSPSDPRFNEVPQWRFAPGDLFAGRYRVCAFVGAGGMGEVYQVEDTHMPQRDALALKTIRGDLAGNPEIAARFEREMRHALALAHPNVCRIYDVGRHMSGSRDVVFLTMEFLSGGTLAARLKDEAGQACALPVSVALPIIRQMTDGLAAIHGRHIVHRDFKPLNVMLVPSDAGTRAVITDLGLARAIGGGQRDLTLTETGAVAGTLAYMSPESMSGSDSATPAGDVYSLGVTILEMLTANRACVADAAKYLKATGVNSHLNSVVVKCLERDPARRYANAGEVAKALENRTWLPRSFVRIAAMVLLGVSLASGAYYWWSNRPPAIPTEAQNWYNRGVDDMQSGSHYAATKKFLEATRIDPDFTMAHVRLAEAWFALEGHNLADREMLKAVGRLTPEEQNYREGVRLTLDGKFEQAINSFRAFAAHATDAHSGQLALAVALERAGHGPEARKIYANLASVYPWASLRMAMADARKGRWNDAQREFDVAVDGFRKATNVEGETEAIYQRGFLSLQSVRLEDARRFLSQALERVQLTHNSFQQVRAEIDMSGVELHSGNTKRASAFAREAMRNATDNRVEVLYGRANRALATVYRAVGDYSNAELPLQDAVRQARDNADERLEAAALTLLSDTHNQTGRLSEAASEAEKAMALYERQQNPQLTVQAARAAANAYRNLGRFQKAADLANEALDAATNAKNDALVGQAQEVRGQIALARQQYGEAIRDLRLALKANATAKVAIAVPYESLQLASALAAVGQFGEAAKLFDSSARLAGANRDLLANLRIERAKMEIYRGNKAAAASFVSGIAQDASDPDRNAEVALVSDAVQSGHFDGRAQMLLKLDTSSVTFAVQRRLHFSAAVDLVSAHESHAAEVALGNPVDYSEMAELGWRVRLLASRLESGEASSSMRRQALNALTAAPEMLGYSISGNTARIRLDLRGELREMSEMSLGN
jgi:tetratricopeptide (TPR) repeat protein